MEVLLDTNFILTCVKEKIYFDKLAEEIIDEEIKWLVPQQVLNELGNLKDREEMKKADRDAAKISFEILQTLNQEIIDLGNNPNVDIGIVNYVLNKKITVATLDKGLKERLPAHRILTIRGKNHLGLI